jgi:hypothetical protein
MVFYGKPSSLNGKAAVKNRPNKHWFLAFSRFSTFAKKKRVPMALKVDRKKAVPIIKSPRHHDAGLSEKYGII